MLVYRTLLAAIATVTLIVNAVANPRCDGFPPRNLVTDLGGEVVGWVAGPCVGQLFPVTARPDADPNAATIKSLSVQKPPRYGRFQMTGLRDFVYTPNQAIIGKGWDNVVLTLTYTLPAGQVVKKSVTLRLTTESEYLRMRAAGTLSQ